MSQKFVSNEVTNYQQIRAVAERRGSNKRILPGGAKVRGYGLSDEKAEARASLWRSTGVFISPYTKGVRTDHLTALARLGFNKVWSLKEIAVVLREIMTDAEHTNQVTGETAWERFERRKSSRRKVDKGATKDTRDKILENLKSFRRLCKRRGLNPYGFRLQQLGCCLDLFKRIEHSGGEGKKQRAVIWYVRLNTYSADPILLKVESREKIPEVDKSKGTKGPVVTLR